MTAVPERGPLETVIAAGRSAARRTGRSLFAPDRRSAVVWLRWGLILLVAEGFVPGTSISNTSSHARDSGAVAASILPAEWPLLGAMIAGGLVLALAFAYAQHLARMVEIDGIHDRYPWIAAPARRNLLPALGYFGVTLGLFLSLLVALAPLALAWWAWLVEARPANPAVTLLLASLSLAWGVPVVLAAAVGLWFVNDLLLPYLWVSRGDVPASFQRAWRLVRSHPLDAALFALARLAFTVAVRTLVAIAFCATCCVWAPAVLLAGTPLGLGFSSWAAFVLLFPLALALALAAAWLIATLFAPLFLFGRAWTLAFVHGLDAAFVPWEEETG